MAKVTPNLNINIPSNKEVSDNSQRIDLIALDNRKSDVFCTLTRALRPLRTSLV